MTNETREFVTTTIDGEKLYAGDTFECPYCDADVPAEHYDALHSSNGCEWVETRAHRLNAKGDKTMTESDFRTKLAAIDASYEAKRDAIDAEYRAKLAPLYTDYQTERNALFAEYEAQRAPLDADDEARRAKEAILPTTKD